MSRRRLLHIVGAAVAGAGVAMLPSSVVSLIYREWTDAAWIAVAAVVTFVVGGVMWRVFTRPGELSTSEAFAAVGLAWLAIGVFSSLPYLFSGAITGVTDAVFEATSGFTTTGASILPDPGALSHGILFWRSTTQWVGGMGIIVMSITILPKLGMGAVQLARAESSGPGPDRLTPRFADTAKRLWTIYAGLTLAETLLLWAGDMTLFEAINHSFTTMSTGGFGTDAGSLGAFSPFSQWVVVVFMIAGSTSFALHYRALRNPLEYVKSFEFRLYMTILGLASAVMAIGTWGNSGGIDTIRDAVFTSTSIMSTTGYATADFALWAPALQIGLLGLMFVGGMAGSTSGSVKVWRLDVLYNASWMDVRRLVHPRGVFVTRIGKNPVPDQIVEATQTFFLLYMFTFMTGTFLLSIVTSIAGTGVDLPEIASAVATTLGGVGPGLGELGPAGNFAGLPAAGKWVLSAVMVVGRLEILPILILFSRELWKR